ncbi:hypothetical protein J14TS2_13680 [Bacillus sp. J14TS2]|uniref:hypothetical protein n=1 Tax=Bacillus sp. J14TS2 TaxID=2807188 RepID=UPI001B206132|nr:hypothetical protein [Bacillus sp. J14TS2]GIN70893.1 hypothetical protein J14TS2_13680 [Bacillus sp. J14TS2]
MLKLKTLVIALCISFIAITTLTGNATAHETTHFHMDQGELQSLIEKGYSKKDIFHAKGIAHLAGKDIEDVLNHHQKSKSWEKTASHFGIDVKEIKAKHKKMKAKHKKMKKFYKDHQEEILGYIAGYSAISPEELKKIQTENSLETYHIMNAAIIAKLSNSALVDIVNEHKAGKKFYDIAQNRNVKKAEFRKEFKRVHHELKRNN